MTEPTPLIEIIEGNYLEAFQASIPETLHTSAEVQAKRVEYEKRKNCSLNQWFYTANTLLYGMDGKTAVHFFGGKTAFLKLYAPSIENVYTQIVKGVNNVYALPPEDAQWVRGEGLKSGALTQFDLKSLIETIDGDEFGHYTINTAKPNKLNGERRAHAELVHGAGDGFYAVMDMLEHVGISQIQVHLPIPKFIKNSSAEKSQVVGWGARLYDVCYSSFFVGGARSLFSHNAFLGVRRRASVSEPESLEGCVSRDDVCGASQFIHPTPEMFLDYIRNKEHQTAILSGMSDADALLLQYLADEYSKKRFAAPSQK